MAAPEVEEPEGIEEQATEEPVQKITAVPEDYKYQIFLWLFYMILE